MLPSYLMPWQEVAGDLYDEVKSLSKGYASFDYDQVRPPESTAHSDPPKGAAATKGGSPGPPIKPGAETNQQDQGPPLTVGTVGTSPCSPHLTSPHRGHLTALNLPWVLRAEKAKGTVPYVRGLMG